MTESDTKEKIHTAITRSEHLWRTATGIARDTGLALETVIKTLETGDGFLQADHTNGRGQSLYTTREKYLSDTPWHRRLLDLIVNKVGV
ncbi:hypothetical protein GJ699_16975 [Duganella sp. FT80W]|uniref:Uncharacterized protein n=1 Tax=Duganella guangzhouensis TaxID=2666084 RepID=A0A6I2L0H6_9BURK|nr:hypothetical protein [Duganella guangzhouensis]MRW91688.1 hypothetical protein [Duganella guangzhouensis]